MNLEPSALDQSSDIALILFGLIVVLAIVLFGRHRPAMTRVLVKLSAIGVMIFVILGFFWSIGQPHSMVENPHTQIAPAVVQSDSFAPSESPPVTKSESDAANSDGVLPEWTRPPVRVDGERKLVVVSSGRFASEQEAELHGFQQAAVIAAKQYSSLDPRGIGAAEPQHTDLVKDFAIKQRFSEVAQHDFGKFQAPMYQLWLQVELTPELGEKIAAPWRQAAVDTRLRLLAGFGLWVTAAAALSAFALRVDSAWNGNRRAAIVGTVIVLALGSLAFIA